MTEAQVQAVRLMVAGVAPPPTVTGRAEFLRACFRDAARSGESLTDRSVSATDLRPGERLELLMTAGSAHEELYFNRLVFLRVDREGPGSVAWSMAVRSFGRAGSPVSVVNGRPVLVPGIGAGSVFAPAAIADVDDSSLQESSHVDDLSLRPAWHSVCGAAYESPAFFAAAVFLSGAEMLHGLGSAGSSGRFRADITIGRYVVFPDEVYSPGVLFPWRWAKPVRAFVAGVFGEDRSNGMPLGMRRTGGA